MEEIINVGGKEIHLIYDIARPEDVAQVAEFSSEHFFNTSPTRELAAFNDPSDETGKFYWNEGRLQKCFDRPTSIVVREKATGKVVAFQAMIVQERNNLTNNKDPIILNNPENCNINDRSTAWLTRALYAYLSRDVDLYARYGTDRILWLWFGAVNKDYWGRKVLSNDRPAFRSLMKKIIRDTGVGALKGYPFHKYATTGKDWEIIRSVNFEDFELSDGKKPLAGVNLGGQHIAKLVAKRVPPLKEQEIRNFKPSMSSRL